MIPIGIETLDHAAGRLLCSRLPAVTRQHKQGVMDSGSIKGVIHAL